MKYHTTVSFWISREQTHTVEVKAWPTNDPFRNKVIWNWNVYAHIFESHPYFNKTGCLSGLTFSGGITYDKRVTTEPMNGVIRDWERKTVTITVGSDYGHSWDDHDNHPSPFNEMPDYVLRDALTLSEELSAVMIEEGGE